MEFYSSIDAIKPDFLERESVVTIGFFDGVHRGHRVLLDVCLDTAHVYNRRAIVITFAQHPLSLLAPPHAPLLLTTAERKVELLAQVGVDEVVCLPFDEALANMEAEVFTQNVLFERCAAKAIVCGHDFTFGRRGRGTSDTIAALGMQKGVEVITLPPLEEAGSPISSSRIRQTLQEGRIEEANALMGRAFDLDGVVVAGFQRGRDLEFPTANLLIPAGICVPMPGVYAVSGQTADKHSWKGMLNIGHAPTFGIGENRFEVHLFGYEGDLYGSTLRVFFVKRMRDEHKFDSPHELAAQLSRDKEEALSILKSD